ncbi:MAG: LptE family protein [Cytophagaceae bacterium]
MIFCKRPFLILNFSFLIILLLNSCTVFRYSFREGQIPPEIQTISIKNFLNEAGGGPPNLSQLFSEKLRTYYQQNTNLIIVRDQADWVLEGRIIAYNVVPVAPQQNETAGSNRLVMNVSVKFTNNVNKTPASFEANFASPPADFPQNRSLTEVEAQLIDQITDQIVLDIFTRTTSTW